MGELIEEENDWRELKEQFLERWPLEKVKSMTLEEYTNLDKNDSFTYWLESKTSDVLGIGGGSSYKFGIFKRNPTASEKKLKSGQMSDREYGWYGKYGKDKVTAFNKIKALVLEVIEATRNNEFSKIDYIDLGKAYKWKIAFMHAGENKLLRIASDKAFKFLAKKYSIDSDNISDIQKILISNKDLNENFNDYSSKLWNEYYDNNFMETEFRDWLKEEKELASSTINKYIKRLTNTIPEELHKSNKYVEITNLIGTRFDLLQKIYSMLQSGGDLYDWNISTKVKSEASAALGNYIEFIEQAEEIDDNNIYLYEKDNKVNNPLNQILYGPPGTGKTYSVINKALEVLLEKEPNQELKEILDKAKHGKLNIEDRKILTKAFKKYKIDGQIEFVTFHQSYGYEEFVEGIKAIPKGEIGNESGNEMIYKVMPGVFRQLCETAFESTSLSKINNSILDYMSESPNIWKISLGWLGSIKDECFKDSVIRIGWDDYGDLNKGTDINQRELKDFYSSMNIGDIVLAFKNQWEIDGIGVVVGEYEFDDSQSEFKHKRKVKWIQINKTIDIKEFNKGKRLTLSTLYRLSRISKTNILNMLVEKNDQVDKEIPSKNYVLVIDEINRGNISKIFGELITLVESSKRLGKEEEIKVSLPYSNQEFGVPSNVYIIGTMNTADRSIALMDTALRRRFDFEEMMPRPKLLEEINISRINIKQLLTVMNQRVEYLYDRDHTIGHSYFMSLEGMTGDEANGELDNIFRNKIIPLLQEYFYDDWEKIQIVLGDHYDQLNFKERSTNEDANSFDDNVNLNRFIQSKKINEIKILGFNHDDIEDDSIDYRVNPNQFETKAYIKIYEKGIVKEKNTKNEPEVEAE